MNEKYVSVPIDVMSCTNEIVEVIKTRLRSICPQGTSDEEVAFKCHLVFCSIVKCLAHTIQCPENEFVDEIAEGIKHIYIESVKVN